MTVKKASAAKVENVALTRLAKLLAWPPHTLESLIAWQGMVFLWLIIAVIWMVITDADSFSPNWGTPVMMWFAVVNTKKRLGYSELESGFTSRLYHRLYVGVSCLMVLLGALIWLLPPLLVKVVANVHGMEQSALEWAKLTGLTYIFLLVQWVLVIYVGGWWLAKQAKKKAKVS